MRTVRIFCPIPFLHLLTNIRRYFLFLVFVSSPDCPQRIAFFPRPLSLDGSALKIRWLLHSKWALSSKKTWKRRGIWGRSEARSEGGGGGGFAKNKGGTGQTLPFSEENEKFTYKSAFLLPCANERCLISASSLGKAGTVCLPPSASQMRREAL